MHKIYSFIFIFFIVTTQSINSQNAEPFEKIDFLLKPVSIGDRISHQNKGLINRQLLSIVSDGNYLNNKYAGFAIQPAVDLLEQGKIEGIKNKITAKINVQFQLIHLFNKEIIKVKDITLTGSGDDLQAAVRKSILNIRKTHPGIKKTISAMRQEVIDYYNKNCGQIVEDAELLANLGKWDEAFAVLHSIPSGIKCFNGISTLKLDYHQKWLAIECNSIMAQAQASEALDNYEKALQLYSSISVDAPCFNDAKQSINNIDHKYDEQLKEDYKWLFDFIDEGIEAETAKWNAMNTLFLNWLKNMDEPLIFE